MISQAEVETSGIYNPAADVSQANTVNTQNPVANKDKYPMICCIGHTKKMLFILIGKLYSITTFVYYN